ncbi:MAG: peptide-methionine (S)-S-oxide reductase MsrA [Janthinobacterium lividum]
MRQKYFFLLTFFLSFASKIYGSGDLKNMKTMPQQEALFAMGCFWSGESAFQDHDTNAQLPGIISIKVGYTGGTSKNPTYESHEGHQEAVQIIFDPSIISYKQLLEVFWHNIDPFNNEGQFCDIGASYIPAIFFKSVEQKQTIEESKAKVEKVLKRPIMIAIKEATPFYNAEEYHQNFKVKNPEAYDSYRRGSRRDQRLGDIWHK